MTSIQGLGESVRSYEAVLVLIDHDEIDWKLIVDHARLVVDTRNVTNRLDLGTVYQMSYDLDGRFDVGTRQSIAWRRSAKFVSLT